MDQKMQLKIQLAEKKAERLLQEEEVLRLKLQIENSETRLSTTKKIPDASMNSQKKMVPKWKIDQESLIAGFNDNCCRQCVVNDRFSKQCPAKTTRFSQCPNPPAKVKEGCVLGRLCEEHKKAHGSPYGRPHNPNTTNKQTRMLLLSAKKCLIDADSFGCAEYLASQPKGHQEWTRKIIANLD